VSSSSPIQAGPRGRGRPVRVIAADEQPLFLDALVRAIRQDVALELIEDTGDHGQLIAAITRSSPDVVLIDAAMMDDAITEAGRCARIVVLAAEIDAAEAYAAIESGAAGYLSKDLDGDVICRALGAVARGEIVLDGAAQTGIAQEIRLRVRDERPLLSSREREILVLVARGCSAPNIARRINVSTATVKTHQFHLYAKLGVTERAAAVAEAMRRGLLD
jgi:two-component system nitrate/nitrite response regulator NarL